MPQSSQPISQVLAGLDARNDSSSIPPLENFIAGEFSTPDISRGSDICDSNTGAPLQEQLCSSADQVETAIASADDAYQRSTWEKLPAAERATYLRKIADTLSAEDVVTHMSVVDALTTGATIRVTRKMAELVGTVFRAAAQYIESGNLVRHMPGPMGDVEYLMRPWGPALLIAPWNAPTAIGSHKIASALAAGATCVFKPSEWSPHSAMTIARAIADAELPEQVFQLVLGNRDIGGTLLADERIRSISFTGGTEGGKAVAKAAAERFVPTQLELGGNNPLVVFEDADLDAAAEGIVFGLSNLNGQWCRALGRLIVHRRVKSSLLDKVLERLSRLKLGHSLDATAEMGPLVHAPHYYGVLGEIDRLQALGGEALKSTTMPPLAGYFIPPTLIDGCDPGDTLGEVFGPVACVHAFDTTAEALALANGTPYGLAAYVYSQNEDGAWQFARQLRTGGTKINGYSLLSLGKGAPRSSWGMSGLGEEGHSQSIEFFCGARVIGASPQDPIGG